MTSERRSLLTFIVLLCSPLLLIGLIYLLNLIDRELFRIEPLPTHMPPPTETPYPEAEVLALVPSADAATGQMVFVSAGCKACHSIDRSPRVGPRLERIAERVPEQYASPEIYILRSIVAPNEYLAPGFHNVMPETFGNVLYPKEIADLIAFLMSQ